VIFKKKDREHTELSRSLSKVAWRKFRRNSIAMFGLTIIFLSVIVSVFGSLIRPDDTEFANNQIKTIARKSPGFSCYILNVQSNTIVEQPSWYSRMFFGGKKIAEDLIPIESFNFEEPGFINYTKYESSDDKRSLVDVLYVLDPSVKPVVEGNNISYTLLNGESKSESISDLEARVEADFIVEDTFWLGTDAVGRDVLSRLMSGTIISLLVGSISVLISLLVGVTLGAAAGFFRGAVDDGIMWLINVVWSIPTLLFVIAFSMAFGKGYSSVYIAVGLTMWVEVARIVRGQVLTIREKEFIEAGRALGYKPFRIIFRHALPNVMGPVIVIGAANFASAILIEAGLSYLDLGTQAPQASWGKMIADYKSFIDNPDLAYLPILPGICIVIMVLAFMLVGNGIRDAIDTKSGENIAPPAS
jgi:peptide/nickel transport system permease protein